MSARQGEVIRVSPGVVLSTLSTPVKINDSWEREKSNDAPTRQYFSRQARNRGMAALYVLERGEPLDVEIDRPFSRVKLSEIRAALDAVTLDDAEEARFRLYPWGGIHAFSVNFDPGMGLDCPLTYKGKKHAIVKALDNGRIEIQMPCGERRRYTVKTLDRALLALGY